jgi:hypothetical protein
VRLHERLTEMKMRLQADALVAIDDSLARRAQGIVPFASLEALISRSNWRGCDRYAVAPGSTGGH